LHFKACDYFDCTGKSIKPLPLVTKWHVQEQDDTRPWIVVTADNVVLVASFPQHIKHASRVRYCDVPAKSHIHCLQEALFADVMKFGQDGGVKIAKRRDAGGRDKAST